MARLPILGGDSGSWGQVLNEFLGVEHQSDGTLKRAGDIAQAQADAQAAQNALANKLDASQKGAANGVATLDANSKLVQNIDASKVTTGVLDINRIPDLSTLYVGNGGTLYIPSADGSGTLFKLIALPDGSVKAVPQNATAPAAPTNLTASVHLTFVELTWQAVSGATQYRVYKDGSLVTTTANVTYTDGSVQLNATYQYYVIAVNTYGMWSPASATVQAFIDQGLNVAPAFSSITVWPSNPRPNDIVYVHVNAVDVDAQQLAFTLGVNVGTLTATTDPSTWIWQGV